MTDPIDRESVINEIVAWTVEDRPDIEMPTDLVGRIKALPSAQPEIIRCKDCKFSDEFDGDVWLCRRRKESFRVLAIDTCNVAKRRTDD